MSIIERCHDRWADLPPFWRFLAVISVAGGVAFAVGRPALGLYQGWRDDGRLNDASKALEAGRHAEVRELALAVLRRDGTRKEAVRVLLRATAALNDPRRTEVALALLADPSSTPDDRCFAWDIACKSSPAWFLQAAWTGLKEEERADPGFVAPLFDRMLSDDMTTEAALLLHGLKPPLAPELDVRLMRLLVAKGSDEAFEEFQRHLIGRLPGLAPDSPIVPLLDEVPQSALRPGLFGALQAWLRQSPSAAPEMELRLARCQLAAEPGRADAIVAETLARHRKSDPLPTARWCFLVRRLAVADEILARLPSSADAEAFRLHARVLEQLGDLDRWSALLATPPEAIPAAWISCEVAHVAELRKATKARDAAADAALKAAGDSPEDDALIRLARQAGGRNLPNLSRRAWLEAIRRRTGPLPLASTIKTVIESLATDKKEQELLEVLTTYRLLEPGNPVIVVQHDYLACLNGRLSPESLIANLQPIHEKLPDALPVSCVLALGHLLSGQPAKAVELTDQDIDWFAASPAYRAIRGLALLASGRHEEASTFLDDFPWDQPLPSEKRILIGLSEAAKLPAAQE